MLAPLLLAVVLTPAVARPPLTAPRPWWVAAVRAEPDETADQLWVRADWLDGLSNFDSAVPETAVARLRRTALARAAPRRRAELLVLGGNASMLPDLGRLFDDFGLRRDPDQAGQDAASAKPADPPTAPPAPADPAADTADEQALAEAERKLAEAVPGADADGDGRATPGEAFAHVLGEAFLATLDTAAAERERALLAAAATDPSVLAAWFDLVLESDDAAVRDRAVAELLRRDGGNHAAHLAAAIAVRRTALEAPDLERKWFRDDDGMIVDSEPIYPPAAVEAMRAALARAAAAERVAWYGVPLPPAPAGLRYPPVGEFAALGVAGEPVPPRAAEWIIDPYPGLSGVFAPTPFDAMRGVAYDLVTHARRHTASGEPDQAVPLLTACRAFSARVMRDGRPDTITSMVALALWREATAALAAAEAARGDAAAAARLRRADRRGRTAARRATRWRKWAEAALAPFAEPEPAEGDQAAKDRAMRSLLRTGRGTPDGPHLVDVCWHASVLWHGFR